MKFRDRQAAPPPAQESVPLPPDVAAASLAAPEAPTAPPPPSWLTVTPDRVQLSNPHIWLQGNVIVRDAKGGFQQQREFTPASAYIAEGALIIEEFGMILPLTSVHIIRKEKP